MAGAALPPDPALAVCRAPSSDASIVGAIFLAALAPASAVTADITRSKADAVSRVFGIRHSPLSQTCPPNAVASLGWGSIIRQSDRARSCSVPARPELMRGPGRRLVGMPP